MSTATASSRPETPELKQEPLASASPQKEARAKAQGNLPTAQTLPEPADPPDALLALEEHMRRDLALAPGVLGEVARQAIEAGGKRMRPALVFLAHQACGGSAAGFETCAGYGTAVEYLHTATLLHDDLIDGASLRRGQPAAHQRFGPKEAVLAGDLLLARCLMHVTAPGDPAAVRALANAAERVAIGEAMEVELTRNPSVDRDRYLVYARSKTGALFAAALELGSRAAHAPEAQVQTFAAFGEAMGTAFQIADDILDVVGDEALTGKSLGADLAAGVPSLPVVEALAAAPPAERDKIAALLEGRPEAASSMDDVLALVAKLGVPAAAKRAQRFAREAQELLLSVPESKARLRLSHYAHQAVERLQ